MTALQKAEALLPELSAGEKAQLFQKVAGKPEDGQHLRQREFSRRSRRTFAANGARVLITHQAGKSNQKIPDEEVLSFAIAEQRIVLTFNRKDFFRLHRQNPQHFRVIAELEKNPILRSA